MVKVLVSVYMVTVLALLATYTLTRAERKPWVAGLCLALVSFKPQLALVRQWAEKYPGETALCLRLHLPELQKTVELDVKEFRGIQASSEALDGLLRLGIPLAFQ